MSVGSPTPKTPRLVERIGSSATVAALALIVVLGLGITLVVLVRESLDEARDSRRSVEITRISDASIALLDALQRERGLGELYLASGDPADRALYVATFGKTDDAAEIYSATWLASGAEIRQEEQGAMTGVTATLAPLEQIRSAVISAEEESPVDLYAGLVDPIRQNLSDMALITNDAEDVRMRRAVLSLLDSSASLATRRASVARLLASSEELTRQLEIQLSLLGRESDVNLRAAQALLTGGYRAEVGELADSAESKVVEQTLERIMTNSEPDATPQSWFGISTSEIDLVLAMAMRLNDEVRDRALQGITDARQAVTMTMALVGTLFALSILAAWSAIIASRERAKALAEHRDLVNGLLRWFGSDSLPSVDGLEMEVRYMPSASHAGAGGDWYDVFFDARGDLALVVGDVAGHGSQTVAHMAEMRNTLRGLAHGGVGGPARQLEIIDQTIETTELTTVFYALISAATGGMRYSRAGHLPAILCRPDGSVELLSEGSDTPVGISPNATRTEASVVLGQDDLLVMFTDGLIEEPGRDLYDSLDELTAQVATHKGSLEGLADQLMSNQPSRGTGDDASILLVRVTATGALTLSQEGLTQTGDLQDP
ncbi:MAG: SpoIIE family protein phosphatase [Acidimicrobiia bacterium]